MIHADQQFETLLEEVKDELDVTLNIAATKEHVPDVEQNNKTLEERIRAECCCLPYKMLPRVVMQCKAMNAAWQLNLFPVKGLHSL